MIVTVKPVGPVAGRMNRIGKVEVDDGTDLLQLKTELGIPRNYPVLFTVNGLQVSQDTVLSPGDQVMIINIFAGG